MRIDNPRVRYHRNGCFGAGFYTVSFTEGRGQRRQWLRAVVFDEPGHVAVTNLHDAGLCYRGDNYEPALRKIIAAAWDNPDTFAGHSCPEATPSAELPAITARPNGKPTLSVVNGGLAHV